MSDDLAARITAAEQAIEDLIYTLHDREMRAFYALHDERGREWARKIDELRPIRELIRRTATITTP